MHLQFPASCCDPHAGFCLGRARGDGVPCAFELHDAQPACAKRIQAVVITERRDLLLMPFGNLENRLTLREFDFLSV